MRVASPPFSAHRDRSMTNRSWSSKRRRRRNRDFDEDRARPTPRAPGPRALERQSACAHALHFDSNPPEIPQDPCPDAHVVRIPSRASHELFDEVFEGELESKYRETDVRRAPGPPALLAMATLLQAYHGMFDAEAGEMIVEDSAGNSLSCSGSLHSRSRVYDCAPATALGARVASWRPLSP